jgi:solute carrier family 41
MEESICERLIIRWLDSHDHINSHLQVMALQLTFSNFSGSGVLLQRFVRQYDALPLILPVTSSLAGNVGCIFAARLATSFHASGSQQIVSDNQSIKSRDNVIVMSTLFAVSIPIHLAFLGFIHLFGTFEFGFFFLFAYLVVGGLSVFFPYRSQLMSQIAFALCLAFFLSKFCWSRGYNPDNFVLGLIAAITDVVTTTLLVLVFKISATSYH